jgi:hypothetical protein
MPSHVGFTPGTMLVFDRGHTDYEWFRRLTWQQVHFVTRPKDNADYGVVEERELPRRKGGAARPGHLLL